MGYTHYYRKPNGTVGYHEALPIIRQILERYKDIVQFECNDDSKPICDDEQIRFNGFEKNGYETFVFNNSAEAFDCCKTGRKAYDVVVCECLIILNHFIPKLEISSDGMCGYTQDELPSFGISSIVRKPDGTWAEAIANVKEHYDIDYKPI